MKKIGPILAILTGVITLITTTLALLSTMDIIKNEEWLSGYAEKLTSGVGNIEILLGLVIALGVLQVSLGIFAWLKSNGIAAYILLALIMFGVVINIIGGVKADKFPATWIISMSIQGLAAVGMISGMYLK